MGHAYENYFSKTYIVCYRKMPKTKNFTISFPGKTLLKLKNTSQKIKQIVSFTCCKHSRPLPYYYWPVIVVLQQFAAGVAAL